MVEGKESKEQREGTTEDERRMDKRRKESVNKVNTNNCTKGVENKGGDKERREGRRRRRGC